MKQSFDRWEIRRVRRDHRRRPVRGLADRDAAGAEGLQGAAGRPGGIPERHALDPLHPPARRGLPRALGAAAGGRGLGTPAGDVADAYSVRRIVLDEILVDAAAAAGAEVRQRFSVQDLVWDGTTVTGVRGRARDGATVTEKARMVIGADGRNSFVARSVQAPVYGAEPSLTCAYYTYWSGVEMAGAELYPRPDRMIVAAPTNDDQVVSIVLWPHADFPRVRADIEGHFLRALELAPSLNERVRSGTRADRFRGTGQLPNFYRRPHGDGWALVGDAGYHKDPILALGITDAFRDAELLAEAVDAGLSGRRELAPALADYERGRNETSAPGYESTIRFARLQPPDEEMQQLLAALRGDQRQTDRFFGTMVGTVHPSEFFTPENLAGITRATMAAAGAA